jgi:hypothetical protein
LNVLELLEQGVLTRIHLTSTSHSKLSVVRLWLLSGYLGLLDHAQLYFRGHSLKESFKCAPLNNLILALILQSQYVNLQRVSELDLLVINLIK